MPFTKGNNTMKKILLIFVCFQLLFSSCNNTEMRKMENELSALKQEVLELESLRIDLESKIKQLENSYYDATQELKMFELTQDLRCLERVTKYGYTRVCGTDNMIEFLNDNYCTHFEYVVDKATLDRTFQSPIIYSN